jgi:hypothetical protein
MLNRNPDTIQQIHQAFVRILDTVDADLSAKDSLGKDRRDSILSTVASGEEPSAFDELVTCLNENDIEVSDQTKADLKFLAESFDDVDNAAGKGKYWE